MYNIKNNTTKKGKKMINSDKKLEDFEVVELKNSFSKQKNIQVMEDKEKNAVILKIYGAIEEPEEYMEELSKLEALSNQYDILEITLNSAGGSLNTTVDIVSLIKNFEYVVTIGKGEVASAAFMLWTMGDVRVVTDYSMYMAHRESYGMYGKTSEHRDAAKVFGMVYEEMFENCFGTLLTKEEKSIAERSEAWISYKDLLKRERVISFDDYITPVNPYIIGEVYVTETGKVFMFDSETEKYRNVESFKFGDESVDDMITYLYGITKINKTTEFKKKTKDKKKNVKSLSNVKKETKEEINNDQQN